MVKKGVCSLRVISGFLKSRIIYGDNIEGTRPTMDRVKSSLFAMINSYIENSICLDLFAGSGQLGIEAISNGCKRCVFCDNNKKCCDVINKNITNLKINDFCEVYLGDYIKNLDILKKKQEKFDIIFLDPPYKMDVTCDILKYIKDYDLLNHNGIIVVETSTISTDELPGYEVLKTKKYGNKYIKIYRSI